MRNTPDFSTHYKAIIKWPKYRDLIGYLNGVSKELKINFIIVWKGLSNYLNMRQANLYSDFKISNTPAASYDTDLENFWTQKSENKFNLNLF